MFDEPFTFLVNCLRTGPILLRWLHGIFDGGIFLAYVGIPVMLVWIYRRMRGRPEARLLYQFGAFIILCGLTHLMSIIAFMWPAYPLFAAIKALTAIVSLWVMVTVYRMRHRIVGLGAMAADLGDALERERAGAERMRDAAEMERGLRAEAERLAGRAQEQLDILESRDRTIRELTSPVLPVRPGVLLIPLVGVVDSARAAELQDRIGQCCEAQRPHHVILDLTGVEAIDTQVASALDGITRMVELLGARCIVTGMRAAVAQAMVGLGIALQAPTRANLADGIEMAVKR